MIKTVIKRDNSIDCVSSILIIWMIVGHAFLWSKTYNSEYYGFFQKSLSFFMAFFFFKSGWFWKDKTPKLILSGGGKLLMPFFLYALFGEVVRWIRLYVQEGDTNFVHYIIYPVISIIGRGGPSGNVPLWFLIALFLTQLAVSIAVKIKIPKFVPFTFALCVSYVGTISNNFNLRIPPVIWEVASGCIFFFAGFYMRNMRSMKIVVFLAFLIYIIAIVYFPSVYDFRKGSLSKGYWILYVLSSIAGCIVFMNLFKLSFLNKSVLGYVGRHSLQFFCFHWILFNIVCVIFGYPILEKGKPFGNCFSSETNWQMFWTLIICCIVFLPMYVVVVKHLKMKHDNAIVRYL